MNDFKCNYCNIDVIQGCYLNHIKTVHEDLCSGKQLVCNFCNDNLLRNYRSLLRHVNCYHSKQFFVNSKKESKQLDNSIEDLIMAFYFEYNLNDKQGHELLKLLDFISKKTNSVVLEKALKSSRLNEEIRSKNDNVSEKTLISGEKYYMVDKKNIIQKALDSIDNTEYISNNSFNLILFLDGVLLGDAFHGKQKRLTQLHVAIKFLLTDVFYPVLSGCSSKNMLTIGLAREKLLTSEDIRTIVSEEIEGYSFKSLQNNEIKAQVYLVVGDNVIMQQLHNKPQYWGCRSKNIACRICTIVPNDYKKALTCAKVDQEIVPSNNQIIGLKHPYLEPMHDYINGVVSYVSYSVINIFIIIMTQYEKNYYISFTKNMLMVSSKIGCKRLDSLITEKYFFIDSAKKNVHKKGVFSGTAIEKEYIAITFMFFMKEFSFEKSIKKKDQTTVDSLKIISNLACNIIKLVHDSLTHSSVLATQLEESLDKLYNHFFDLIPNYEMSFKFHTALHGPHVLKNTGHFSNINCFGFEHHHQFLKKIGRQFRGGYNYLKSLLSKVCLAQEQKISENNFEEAIELYDKIFRNYEYIEPQSIVSDKTISLNQSYEKEKLFLFEELPEDSDMEVDC
uniref:C2H2-type domain-containing protein n=1 Tax=Strongyloides venezuelensis TaxID=75913 RepID=A0A0K0FT81_STRVS